MFLHGFGLVSELCLASAGCAKRKLELESGNGDLGSCQLLSYVDNCKSFTDLSSPATALVCSLYTCRAH